MTKASLLTCEIIEIGAKGDGIARENGAAIYVAKTAPGDVIEAAVKGEHGTIQKIITPSPVRAEPPCPYFSKCGGCSLQHVTPEYYGEWKIKKVQAALARENVKVDEWQEPVFLPAATRRRASMAAINKGGRIVFGYNEVRSHNVIDIRECLILNDALEAKILGLRPYLPRILPEGKECGVTIQNVDGLFGLVLTGPLQKNGRFSLEQDEAFGELMEALDIARLSWRLKDFGKTEIILSRKPVIKKFGSVTVALPPAAFLQASREGEDTLVKLVVENLNGAKNVADLFSGSGTFAGHIAQFANVTAIDGDNGAIASLAAARHPRITAKQRDLFKNPLSEPELDVFDAVVFDPPRAGAKEQAGRLAYANTRKIIGVSCNPVSFARDAAILSEGGFTLKSVTMVDQFVWSAHVEIAGVFTK
jgi:23S rRNA (uracil1939-C5)-methyltransferase